MNPEALVQSQILRYLRARRIRAFRINAGMWEVGQGNHRQLRRLAANGFAGIIGALADGQVVFVAISSRQRATAPLPRRLVASLAARGARAFAAGSVEEVARQLAGWSVK